MSEVNRGEQEIAFFRKMTALGALFLIAISVVNHLFPSEITDYPRFRLILAGLSIAFFLASFRFQWVKDNSSLILASLLYGHALSMVWCNYLNQFDIFDTSTSLVVGFALGAAFRKRTGLLGYLLLIAVSYSVSFFISEKVHMPADYFFITLTMLIGLAWMVFSSKIKALDDLHESQEGLVRSEATFRNIFEWAPVGIILLDMEWRAFQVNQVVLNHTGYSEEDFLNQKLEEWIQEPDIKGSEDLRTHLEMVIRKKGSLEHKIVKRNGNEIMVKLSLAKLNSPSMGDYIMAMVEDITFQKKASQKLREYAQSLKQNNKALQDFSYVVSHDLQEPLRMIKSYTQIINRKYISKLQNEEAEKDMYYVIDGAERMSILIRDMLAYTRMSAKPLEKEKIETSEIIYDVLKNLTISIKERKAAVFIDELPEVDSNKMLFGQVVQNLVGNGLKYCSVDRQPEIRVSAMANESETTFCIKDNGVGFSDEQAQKIFGIFQRIHSTSNREKGTGIGLAICQRIVEKHGGRIWAEGVPGEGASFYFTLPNQKN